MTINCPHCNKLTIKDEPECIECGEDISDISEESEDKTIILEKNCIWCNETNKFFEEAGKIEGTWSSSRLHIKILSCVDCGYIHLFRGHKSHLY